MNMEEFEDNLDSIEVGMIWTDEDSDWEYTRCPICNEVEVLYDCMTVPSIDGYVCMSCYNDLKKAGKI